ncbi:MAG: glycosyl transferase family 2 [Opitutaceae bacterium]|nr:glycosyl transferase family 2 [Opitutaceae bacterium]
MSLRDTVRRLGFGRLALALWHQPAARLRTCIREGGPLAQRRTERGRLEMEQAAARLTPVPAPAGPPVELHLLTGRRFWYQTAFCLASFARQAGRPVHPVIYDDGTLAGPPRDGLARLFPDARFVAQPETLARLERHLPESRFPVLRERWRHYPNIRKLTDVHAGTTGWKLVLDSDLLFFRRPDVLLAWLDQPSRPLHAVDIEESYGYPRPLLAELAGAPLAPKVNVGLCGLDSGALDWELLERACRLLLERHGTNYYLEQALVALLVAGRPCTVAPAADYVTLPRPPEALDCRAVMHHYVAESKRWYFQRNWRRFATPDA